MKSTHTLTLLLLALGLSACFSDSETSDEASMKSPHENDTVTLTLNGASYEMEIIQANWLVLESSRCGLPQEGSLSFALEGERNGEKLIVSSDLNFDGVTIPSGPLPLHSYTQNCVTPNTAPLESGIGLHMVGPPLEVITSTEGMTTFEAERLDEHTASFSVSFADVKFTTEDGEILIMSGSFETNGIFTDSTDDRRFSN